MNPLADRLRPTTFDDMVGQEHLLGERGALRRIVGAGFLPNMIFYGPPGTGKTTAANIIAAASDKTLCRLNATTASLSDIREVTSQTTGLFGSGGVLLYLDEIQYFNKKQQQSLLEFLEDGRVTLIASTTENPYFYVYNALLSRSSVFEFRAVRPEQTVPALRRGLALLNRENSTETTASEDVLLAVAQAGAGDVRRALGLLENAYYTAENGIIDRALLEMLMPSSMAVFDRDGDAHYDTLSALQKSIRGSDPDAALFYLAKLLSGGDLFSACRRLLVIASEDVGAAYPMAAAITQACVTSARELGLPEARIPLANAAVLLATAPKSNSAYEAYERAAADVQAGRGQKIPEHLRDAHYEGAQKMGHGGGYRYPHAFPDHYVAQQYLPDDLANAVYYEFGENKTEQTAKQYAERIGSLKNSKK
ncbi:MAG: replication-associated recombination protein A [Clostridia bacterium]|nr:replication-associated recombination protein A [Clostridia bacterium]